MTSRVNLTTMVSHGPFKLASGDVYTTLTLADDVNKQVMFKTADLCSLVEIVNRAHRVWLESKVREAAINEELKTL